MTAWSHLPNAAHIDRIIADAQARPAVWAAAWDVSAGAALNAAYAAQAKVRYEVRGAAWDAAWGAAWDAGRGAAYDAILALVAYDDSAQFLTMTPEQLRVWYHLSEHPACILLLPAVTAFQTETV